MPVKPFLSSPVRSHLITALILVGCLQFLGYLLENRKIRGLGISWCVAPLPTVFSTVAGVEGFSSEVALVYENPQGSQVHSALDAELYGKFQGSYFLKNAYALYFSYHHTLKPELAASGLEFALCEQDFVRRVNSGEPVSNPKLTVTRANEYIELIPKCPEQD